MSLCITINFRFEFDSHLIYLLSFVNVFMKSSKAIEVCDCEMLESLLWSLNVLDSEAIFFVKLIDFTFEWDNVFWPRDCDMY